MLCLTRVNVYVHVLAHYVFNFAAALPMRVFRTLPAATADVHPDSRRPPMRGSLEHFTSWA